MQSTWGLRAALLLAAALFLSACQTELYSGLTEREANEIVAALLDAGIPASKEAARSGEEITVLVDKSRFSEAMALLNAKGLPSARYESLGDVFQKEGIVSSPVEERARFIYALSQELSQTIAEIDGVLSARIHVVLPETDMLGRDFQPSSASVFIRHVPDIPVEQFLPNIKLLVANSIEGLVYDNVTVVTVPALDVTSGAATPLELAQFAGIWVHPGSLERLQLTLGGLGLLAVAGIGAAFAPQALRSIRRSGGADEFPNV